MHWHRNGQIVNETFTLSRNMVVQNARFLEKPAEKTHTNPLATSHSLYGNIAKTYHRQGKIPDQGVPNHAFFQSEEQLPQTGREPDPEMAVGLA
jgi:hypothetical protein